MTDFELTFHIRELPELLVDDLLDKFDCITGTDHSGQDFITLTASSSSCVKAAKDTMMRLVTMGLSVERMQEDLASRAEIAERLSVTRQAVGNWVRGERADGFPAPFNEVAGGVWLWGDVARWAVAHDRYDADGIDWPTRDDHDLVNGWITTQGQSPFMVMEQLTMPRVRTASPREAALASMSNTFSTSGQVKLRSVGTAMAPLPAMFDVSA
jgi:hypothetical protein